MTISISAWVSSRAVVEGWYGSRDDGLPAMEKVICVTTNLVSLYITKLTASCVVMASMFSSSAVDRRIDKPKTL